MATTLDIPPNAYFKPIPFLDHNIHLFITDTPSFEIDRKCKSADVSQSDTVQSRAWKSSSMREFKRAISEDAKASPEKKTQNLREKKNNKPSSISAMEIELVRQVVKPQLAPLELNRTSNSTQIPVVPPLVFSPRTTVASFDDEEAEIVFLSARSSSSGDEEMELPAPTIERCPAPDPICRILGENNVYRKDLKRPEPHPPSSSCPISTKLESASKVPRLDLSTLKTTLPFSDRSKHNSPDRTKAISNLCSPRTAFSAPSKTPRRSYNIHGPWSLRPHASTQ